MKAVRLDRRPSRCPPPAPAASGGAGTGSCDLRLVPGLRLERATAVTSHEPDRSLQIVHLLGRHERLCATGPIAAGIEPLGARQGLLEVCLCSRLGPRYRAGRRLAIKLRTNGLPRKRSSVWIACGLPQALLELRDRVAARTGMQRGGAEAQDGDYKSGSPSHDVTSRFECASMSAAFHLVAPPTVLVGKTSIQSSFMLITIQPF